MKIEELKELKEKVEQLIKKRNEVLEIQEEIKKLEETDEIKKYLNLLNLFKEKTTGRNTGIEKFTNKKIIDIAVSNTIVFLIFPPAFILYNSSIKKYYTFKNLPCKLLFFHTYFN